MPHFAAQLAVLGGRPCEVATDLTRIRPGRIFVAPGDRHMRVVKLTDGAAIRLVDTPAPSGCLPSVDPMFDSVADVFGAQALGVVLSGMGRDGAIGAARLHRAGGCIVVQDVARSVVWGMPGAAVAFDNAFAYSGQKVQISHRDGDAEAVVDRRIPAKDQFALELDHMAECVATGRRPRPPGEEGLAAQRIMEAIYRSAETGQPVSLPKGDGLDTTRGPALPPDTDG